MNDLKANLAESEVAPQMKKAQVSNRDDNSFREPKKLVPPLHREAEIELKADLEKKQLKDEENRAKLEQ